ncbi:response regulator transcription factor [Lysobacter sp. N42]|uniref:response regulator transcription factor n=1 Tax=Lysobacter sp. N42 TaxID=2545719 RepID=UPI00104DDE9B|nr:response regulator transcription factor [Lysobacter sp. N42]TCZ88131.1 response regulator transcription factor [Lysobacter sp. N42]
MQPLKIVLVDDHPIVRAGFRQLLDMQPGWQAVELGSAAELAAQMRSESPDVLVLDLSLADADGLVLLRHVLTVRPSLPVIVLSMHDSALYVQDAIAAGARGYVTKRSGPDEIVDAVHAVLAGRQYLSRDLRAISMRSSTDSPAPELTARESQVWLLIARGHSVARVAKTMGVSPKTVYAHRSSIYGKLGVSTDHELRQLAARRGLV